MCKRFCMWMVPAVMLAMVLPAYAGADETFCSVPAPDVPALLKGGETPAEAVRRLVKEGVDRWSKVSYSEVTFTRRELLGDKTARGEKEVILVRERAKPRGIYMKWLEGPGKDRELAYVPERDGDKFMVTPGGLLRWLVVERGLNHADVLAASRHTPAEAGMGSLLHRLDHQFDISLKDAVVQYVGESKVGDRPCYRFTRFLPEKAGSDGTKYYCWKLDLSIDKELCLPVGVMCYGWKREHDWQKEPFEEYLYTNFVFGHDPGEEAFQVRKPVE